MAETPVPPPPKPVPGHRARRVVVAAVVGCVAVLVLGRACHRGAPAAPAGKRQEVPAPVTATAVVEGVVVDAAGAPLPGAEISITADVERTDVPVVRGVTDSQGQFHITGVPVTGQDVTVHLSGYESVTRRVEQPGAASLGPLRFVLARAGVVHGRVVSKDGVAVPDAAITIVGSGIWPARALKGGKDGAFSIGDVPEGIYALRAEAPGVVSSPLEGLRIAAGETVDVSLHMEQAFGFAGRVVAKGSDQAVTGARVWLREGAFGITTRAETTDKDGRFRMDGLRKGAYRLSAHAAGFVTALDVQVTLPQATDVVVGVAPACVVTGRVLDAAGRAVSGARLEVTGTDEDGLPVHIVDVTVPPSAADNTSGLVPAGHLGVTVGSVPAISTAGTVRAGAAPGADVPAFASGDDGGFRLDNLPPGELRILASARGYAASTSDAMTLTPGASRTDVVVTMAPGGDIDGRVVDSRGDGVGNVDVILSGTTEPLGRIVRTDGGGRFRFEGVAGKVTLTATPVGLPPSAQEVVAAPGTVQTVQLTLESQVFTLRGRTTDDRGFPIGGVRVGVTSLKKGSHVVRTLQSDADGTFVIDGLPAPPYRITAEHDAYALTQLTVNDTGRDVMLPLTGGVSVSGRVTDPWDGRALPHAAVTLTPTDGRRFAAETDKDGRFAFARIAAGTYTVTVKEPTHVPIRRAVVFEASVYGDDTFDLGDFELERASGLSGVVVDALGDPVPGAQVTAGNTPDWSTAVRTGKDGTFRVGGLPAGTPTVFVRHPSAGETTDGPYRVGAGEDTADLRIHLPGRMER